MIFAEISQLGEILEVFFKAYMPGAGVPPLTVRNNTKLLS